MEYNIVGDSLPVVICKLAPGESVVTEGGSMSWMTPNITMETKGGGLGKMLGRLVSGDNMFQNIYTAQGPAEIAFSSSFPGQIRAYNITPGNDIIVQKSAFLACTQGVEMSIFFNKKIGSGLFGGEGFIMQKLSGNGIVFVEIDGFAVDYTLEPGQTMIVDTGNLAMMSATCTMDIQMVKGAKNILLGGEGLFNTVITGPGTITLQTMPISGVANVLRPYFPPPSN